MADAVYQFISSVRAGFAATITQPETFGAAQPALATAPITIAVPGAPDVHHDVVVHGPGDVIGIAASQVVRTDPIDGATGVEPNYFALIEFDRPDLPWMFTPAAATPDGRLRPWLALVVVDADGPDSCGFRPGTPLPVLSVPANAAAQLPALADSALWAHAQVVTPDGQSVDAALAGDPRLAVSRLLCPRHLQPDRRYLAAVVPAFEVGRLAGLGQAVSAQDEQTLAPAWTPGAAVELPVYYSWRFGTGADADFESLARRLQGRALPAGVGTRPLDVSRPGAGLPALPVPADTANTAAIVWLDGALEPVDSDTLPQRDAVAAQTFATELTILLDRPAELLAGRVADPIVAPPIYGDKHALVVRLDSGTPPPWIQELNLEPRARVAAGLGTQVIQAHQEDYVARSWRQLGDVLAANRLLRAAQLARTGALNVHQRLGTLDATALLAVASPAHARVVGAALPQKSVTAAIAASRLPDVTVEPAFRRLTRAGTAVGRAAAAVLAPNVVGRFASEVFTAPVDGPDGVTAMRPPTEVLGPSVAQALLTSLGDTAATPGRADTLTSTLTAAATTLPSGAAIRGVTLRADVGAVSTITSIGAVPAAVIETVLGAATGQPATPPPAPPASPPVSPPWKPPVVVGPPLVPRPPVRPPVLHPPVVLPPVVAQPLAGPIAGPIVGLAPVAASHAAIPVAGAPLASGLAGQQAVAAAVRRESGAAAGARLGGIIFHPPGPVQPLPGGIGVLRGGTVTIDTDVVRRIVGGTTAVSVLGDDRWHQLETAQSIPAVNASADPLSDAGARLNVLRESPDDLTALALVASGDRSATLRLDAAAGALATTGSGSGVISRLATGIFQPNLPVVTAGVSGGDDLQAGRDLVQSVAGALDLFVHIGDAPEAPAGPAFDLAASRTGLLERVDPQVTVAARVNVRLTSTVIAGVARRDDLDPIMASPIFTDPMWQALRDLGSSWLLPGLEKVPPDTATVVQTNPGFVAAHLVGLNHEIMRELLWREYPTDQRGTPFTHFWGRPATSAADTGADIGPVHRFSGDLVDNLLTGKAPEIVLLLRSELLRRYPGSIIYLSRGRQQGQDLILDDDRIQLPVFRGDLPPDISFVGFPVTAADLRAPGDPWYFVIAQPPAEPRFGLDDPTADTPATPASSSDLAWSHMAAGPGDADPLFAIADPPALHGHQLDGSFFWGANSGVQAHLTYQHPVRVAILASDLLPAPVPPAPAAPGGAP